MPISKKFHLLAFLLSGVVGLACLIASIYRIVDAEFIKAAAYLGLFYINIATSISSWFGFNKEKRTNNGP